MVEAEARGGRRVVEKRGGRPVEEGQGAGGAPWWRRRRGAGGGGAQPRCGRGEGASPVGGSLTASRRRSGARRRVGSSALDLAK